MKKMGTNEIREIYLKYFEDKGHVRLPSAPLVPENDPTTLFTGSGMQPMVPYLLGQKHPLGDKLTDSQKCFRAVDMDEIGDNRHTSFFEMLGNWSLGAYYKKEQITWMFDFLTRELGLDPERLYVTVFRGQKEFGIPRDEESVKLWQGLFTKANVAAKDVDLAETKGMQGGRIFYYDESKNWWSRAGVPAKMPIGEPGGPDSEMFWDFGEALGRHEKSAWKNQPCHVNCDCGRFMEIGNNVFMEYVKTENGFKGLPQRNVDFGGGLERLAAAVNNDPDIFQIDVLQPVIHSLERLSGKIYGQETTYTRAFRVIADHARAATFLIADGVMPGNKDQGYFVRRLIRRAVRFGQTLDLKGPFLATLADIIARQYHDAYPEVGKKTTMITDELTREETKFRQTLDTGLKKIFQIFEQQNDINGQQAFELYSTFGFPIELLREEAKSRGKEIDLKGFNEEMKKHRELSRTASVGKFRGGLTDQSEMSVKYHTATHLLHQALRQVLGEGATQRGSNITPDRLRFDFAWPQKLSAEEKAQVAKIVNEQIAANLPVVREEMTTAVARAKGALGLFAHKYGEKVSVYSIGNFSREICGGPHVTTTGTLGKFEIIKEESAGAGIRRIKAVLKG